MTRPRKRTVDYFPHYCRHGKTMTILEQKYGNDGYAFWFKLLEILGDSENHYADMNDPMMWEFLQSKTHLDDSICLEILNLLSRLGAIDSGLWENKVVWSDNFTSGIADCYRNRKEDTPIRPDNLRKKPVGEKDNLRKNDVRNPHRRGEERIGENKYSSPSPDGGDNGFDKFWQIYPKKVGKKEALKAYKKAKDKPQIDRLISIITVQRRSDKWQENDGQYIPNPATWLNQGRWDDVLETRSVQFSGPCPKCKCKPCICGSL